MSRVLVKRIQRKVLGGTMYVRIYDDGSSRMRFDHPSNDPATELAAAALILEKLGDSYRQHGMPLVLERVAWSSDA